MSTIIPTEENVAANKPNWQFPRTFWTANIVELFERAAYYAVFIAITLYLSRVVGFDDIDAAWIGGIFAAGLYFFLQQKLYRHTLFPSLLALLLSVLAFFLWNYGISRLEASKAAVFTNLAPVFTVLGAYLLLGERIHLGQIIGGALVIGGVSLAGATHSPIRNRNSA